MKLDLDTILDAAKSFLSSPKGIELIKKNLGVDTGNVDGDDITKAKKDADKIKKILRSIRIEVFTVKGRLYDLRKKTNIPGIPVSSPLVLYPIVPEKNENGNVVYKKSFFATNKEGIVEQLDEKRWNRLQERRNNFDNRQEQRQERQKEKLEEGEELEEAKSFRWSNFKTTERISYIQDPSLQSMSDDERKKAKEIKTDGDGEFEIKFGIPVIGDPDYPVVPLRPILLYNTGEGVDTNFTPYFQQMIKGDHVIKEQLPPVGMLNIKELSKEEKQKVVDEINKLIDEQIDILFEPVERTINAVKKEVLGFATIAQQKLLPLAIGLLINFGIAKLAQKNQARCPDNTILKQCIKRRNSIVRQLNNIYSVIITNSALAVAFLILTKNFAIIEKALDKLPIPLQFASYSLVGKLQEIKELLITFAKEFKDIKKSILISLIILVICLFIILKYLKTIDLLIGDCADGELEMEEINSELLALQAQQDAQGETPDNFVNGFELIVVADTENAQNYGEGDLYQRYAVAKDSRGIVILKGEKSFAADDQILIDELAFYIKQNDLKAN